MHKQSSTKDRAMHIRNFTLKSIENIYLILIILGYFLFPWKLNQGIALIGMGLLIWLIINFKNPDLRFLIKDPLVILILLFLSLCILQIREIPENRSISVADSISRYYKYFFSVLAIGAMMDTRLRNHSVRAFFISVLLIIVSMHLNIFWNLPWSNTTTKGWGNDQTVVGDYITQNLFTCLFVILAIDSFIKSTKKYHKIFFIIAALLGVHAILFLSIGRTGYVLLTVSLGVYALWAIQSKLKWLVLIGLAGVVSLAIYSSDHASQRVQLAMTEATNAVDSIKNDKVPDLTSIGARIYMWDQSLNIVSQKPIFGWGIGSYPQRWCTTVPEVWCNETAKYHPHNQYLMFWIELGFPGVILFLAIMFYLSRTGMKDKKHGGTLISLVAILFIDSFINSPLYVRREYQFFLLCIPLMYSFVMPKIKTKESAIS
ncbi:O-antigen ligase family protein [Comamonas resistens]|uniref:O-antigen ligase family protein n=1 Tax=Comamonas resistens TaxID=3046670 RepID=UPI0039BD48A5